MSENQMIRQGRGTAYMASSLVETPSMSLLRDEIPEGALMFSFDPSDPDNEQMVFKSAKDGTRTWEQHIEHPFKIVNWVVKKIMLPNETTKELNPAVRIVFFDDEGETLVFVSVGVAMDLDLIRTLRGDGPYNPPIPVTVSAVKTRNGFKTLRLTPVPRQVIVGKAKSK